MNNNQRPIVIIGAGVTGLTLAHKLKKAGLPFIVLEKQGRAGGVVNTQTEQGFTYESGPNSGIISHPEVVTLFDELGQNINVEKGNDLVKVRYVLKNNNWQALPSSAKSAILTPLFTWKDKFNILIEPFRTRGKNPNETLAQLVKRRLGNSFLDYAIDPFVLGIYSGDPSQLVTRFAFPKLYILEQTYGSFIGGSIKKAKLPKSELEKRTDRSVFSFVGGLSTFTNALYESAGKDNFVFDCEQLVVNKNTDGSYNLSYTKDSNEYQLNTNQVISTIGSTGLETVLPFITPQNMSHLTNLPYARVVEVSLGFDEWEGSALDGFGGLIPHKENRNVLGVLFMSSLFKNRAPEGGALLTIFIGGVRNDGLCDLSDDEILHLLETEITDLMKIPHYNPSLIRLKRYAHAIPQYGIETEARYAAIATVEKDNTGLIIAGNLRDGIGMADRIKQATLIANNLITNHR